MRGEKHKSELAVESHFGSSPRAWGKGARGGIVLFIERIIPTCVGKSLRMQGLAYPVTDHPHVRGEKVLRSVSAKTLAGSSPRAWGKVSSASSRSAASRIIPTCVGKSTCMAGDLGGHTDHPHVRGEKRIGFGGFGGFGGSSPRAWGKVARGREAGIRGRIIPTCVGKSLLFRMSCSPATDHPHVRGEKLHDPDRLGFEFGSSPRAWGKAHCFSVDYDSVRIIPTCVGKRDTHSSSPARSPDHPHVRGEKAV